MDVDINEPNELNGMRDELVGMLRDVTAASEREVGCAPVFPLGWETVTVQ
jgi:hypothetical protein